MAAVEVREVEVKTTTTDKSAGAELNISALNPDADGDGNVSPLEMEIYKSLKAADVDGSGSIGVGELYKVISDLVGEKRKVKNLSKLVAGLLLIIVLALGSIFVVSLLAGEAIKENKTQGATKNEPWGPVSTAGVESFATIWDLPATDTNVLAYMRDINFYVDMTNVAAIGGVVEATFKLAGAYKRTNTRVFLKTTDGGLIDIDGSTKKGTITMDGATYPILDTPPATGRRLETADDTVPDPIIATRREVTKVLEEDRRRLEPDPQRRRELWQGGGRGGAFLSTTGSFTLSSGNAFGNGRRQLGDRRGMGRRGAMLDYGSFTMSAGSNRAGND